MASIEGWHPIALSSSIDPGTSAGTRLRGQELVVWRDNSGVAHVWEDRCPHRGMKLSFGFVRGDHIACLYHGWQYDSAGQCKHIPAHPDLDVPKTIRTHVLASAERAGMIWLGPAADSAEGPAFDGGAETVPVRSIYVDCPAAGAIEAVRSHAAPFSAGANPVRGELSTLADNLLRLAIGPDTLLIGLQQWSETRTAMHVVLAGGPAEHYAGAGQLHYLAWANELRFRIENPSFAAVAPGMSAVA